MLGKKVSVINITVSSQITKEKITPLRRNSVDTISTILLWAIFTVLEGKQILYSFEIILAALTGLVGPTH